MKVFKHRNMMGIIYSLLLAIPVLSIGVRSAYVVVNKNAYQSYSGETTQNQVYTQTTVPNMVVGDYYYYSSNGQEQIQRTGTDLYIYAHNISVNNVDYNLADNIQFYAYPSGTSTALYCVIKQGSTTLLNRDLMTNDINLYFVFESYNETAVNQVYLDGLTNFYKITYNNNGALDNVFEYALDSVIKENNFGKIDFLSWFSDLFLNDNDVNNRYVGYANWYMNYVLFVSCAFILFLCLMWFVNFSRRVLERGMNYDW